MRPLAKKKLVQSAQVLSVVESDLDHRAILSPEITVPNGQQSPAPGAWIVRDENPVEQLRRRVDSDHGLPVEVLRHVFESRATVIRDSAPALLGVGRWRETHLVFELVNEMRLVVVAKIARDGGPIDGLTSGNPIGALLNASAPHDPLAAHPDVLFERTMQTAHREVREPSQIRGGSQGAVRLGALDPLTHALEHDQIDATGPGKGSAENRPDVLDENPAGLVRIGWTRGRRAPHGMFCRPHALGDLSQGQSRHREESGGTKAQAGNPSSTRQPRNEPGLGRAVDVQRSVFEGQIHVGKGQDFLLEGVPLGQIPTHRPQPAHEPAKICGRCGPVEIEVLEADARSQNTAGRIRGTHEGILGADGALLQSP